MCRWAENQCAGLRCCSRRMAGGLPRDPSSICRERNATVTDLQARSRYLKPAHSLLKGLGIHLRSAGKQSRSDHFATVEQNALSHHMAGRLLGDQSAVYRTGKAGSVPLQVLM